MSEISKCPFCTGQMREITEWRSGGDTVRFHCESCGDFELVGTLKSLLDRGAVSERMSRNYAGSRVAHYLRWESSAANRTRPVLLSSTELERLESEDSPPIETQIGNAVRWLRERVPPGGATRFSAESASIFGSRTKEEALVVAIELAARNLVLSAGGVKIASGGEFIFMPRLSASGHAYYDEMVRSGLMSKKAFMAMPFGVDLLNRIYTSHLQPAINELGFVLRRVDEEPRSGLIDAHIELAIRESRFLLVELTGNNAGAYWEAGLAEGLGKPVIYLCTKDHFEGPGTHFDTSHRQTIVWDVSTIESDMRRLQTIVRLDLPGEVRPSES